MAEPAWPSVESQLADAQIPASSPLEQLIRENQDFHLLRPEEASDRIGLPPWLRVYWRKKHPGLTYSADDPTGGYPRALKNLHAWMIANPDLSSHHGSPPPPEA
jgi:hypothetical protein